MEHKGQEGRWQINRNPRSKGQGNKQGENWQHSSPHHLGSAGLALFAGPLPGLASVSSPVK